MKRLLFIAALSCIAAPLASIAQTTIFQDTFSGGDSLNPTSAVTPTSTTTAYEIGSGKSATATALSTGSLKLAIASTSSGYVEAQAQFTTIPVTLSSPGQYIEIYATITDPANFFNSAGSNNDGIDLGLFNSEGTPLTDGAGLWNSGLVSTSGALANGDAQGWEGFSGNIQFSGSTTMETSTVQARPAQTGTTNINQGLGDESGSGVLSSIGVSNSSTALLFPALTNGSQYTVSMQIEYIDANDDYFTESILSGSGTTGTVLYTYSGENTNGSILTDTFDSLDVGFRSVTSPSAAVTVPINDITVVDGVTAVVPEPSTFGFVCLAMVGGIFLRRRWRRPV